MGGNKALFFTVFALVILSIAGEESSSSSLPPSALTSDASSSTFKSEVSGSTPGEKPQKDDPAVTEKSAEVPTRPPASVAGDVAVSAQPPLVHSTSTASVAASPEKPPNTSSQTDTPKSSALAVSYQTTLVFLAIFAALVSFM